MEKYKEKIMSVYNILTNDRSNQEVALAKDLAAKGKLMGPSLIMKSASKPVRFL